jgi:hypothetical protein
MSVGRTLCICFFAVTVRGEEEVSGARVMRRQLKDAELHVVASGELSTHKKARNSWCDEYYPLGNENANTCKDKNGGGTLGKKIIDVKDCEHAAAGLNLTFVGSENKDPHYTNGPAPFPKHCFKLNDEVHFNPSDNYVNYPPPGGLTGTPICADVVYTNGTAGTAKDGLCPDGYELIQTWEECEWAHDCEFGGASCLESNRDNDFYKSNSAVIGCFREWATGTGCFGFNNQAEGDWNPTGQSDWQEATLKTEPICRLSSHPAFARHPKFNGEDA